MTSDAFTPTTGRTTKSPVSSLLANSVIQRAQDGRMKRASLLIHAVASEQETSTGAATGASTTKTREESSINPRSVGLALQLDDGTRKSHSVAQNSAFVTGFFKGISTRSSYRQLLTSLYYVYKAMEVDVLDQLQAMEEVDGDDSDSEMSKYVRKQYSSMIRLLDDPSLRRLRQLEKDMLYFYGQGNDPAADITSDKTPSNLSIESINIPPPTPATQRYVNRIREIINSSSPSSTDSSNDKLYLFVAHQYTRYLGDLFGGQMMGKMAVSSLDLPLIVTKTGDGKTSGSSAWGVQFYTFDGIPNANQYITNWYERLNSLDLSDEQKQEIVDEANLVFDLNIELLQELEDESNFAMITTIWKLAMKSLSDKVGIWKKDDSSDGGKYRYTFNTK
jgi:heme oxygenase